jgi:hypothetical protein
VKLGTHSHTCAIFLNIGQNGASFATHISVLGIRAAWKQQTKLEQRFLLVGSRPGPLLLQLLRPTDATANSQRAPSDPESRPGKPMGSVHMWRAIIGRSFLSLIPIRFPLVSCVRPWMADADRGRGRARSGLFAGRRIDERERQRPAGNATATELGPAACLRVPAKRCDAIDPDACAFPSDQKGRGEGSAVFTRRAPGLRFCFVPAQKRRGLAQRSVGSDAIRLIIPLPNTDRSACPSIHPASSALPLPCQKTSSTIMRWSNRLVSMHG